MNVTNARGGGTLCYSSLICKAIARRGVSYTFITASMRMKLQFYFNYCKFSLLPFSHSVDGADKENEQLLTTALSQFVSQLQRCKQIRTFVLLLSKQN